MLFLLHGVITNIFGHFFTKTTSTGQGLVRVKFESLLSVLT